MTDTSANAPQHPNPAPAPAPQPAGTAQPGWSPPRRRLWTTLGVAVMAVIAISLVLYAWRLPPFVSAIQSTENAYVKGQVTLISPQTSGYVAQVLVQDFQVVKADQVLVRIDDRIYQQRVEQARANLAAQQAALANSAQSRAARAASLGGQGAALNSARAQLARAEADMRRVDDLVKDGSVSLRERDQTLAALRQAQAGVQQAQAAQETGRQDVRTVEVGRGGLEAGVAAAEAALKLAEIDLANTVIRAPRDGQLGEVGVRVGQYVTAGTQLTALVPANFWIIANFKEAQTADMVEGQPASFRVDALGGAKLTGRVERLSPAAGSEFSVLKPDNATGNFTKVAQRIPVRIAIDPDQARASRLRAGMSVVVSVNTKSHPRRTEASR